MYYSFKNKFYQLNFLWGLVQISLPADKFVLEGYNIFLGCGMDIYEQNKNFRGGGGSGPSLTS